MSIQKIIISCLLGGFIIQGANAKEAQENYDKITIFKELGLNSEGKRDQWSFKNEAKDALSRYQEVWKDFLITHKREYIRYFSSKNIPQKAIQNTLNFFINNLSRFSDQQKILINDYTKAANEERSFLIDLVTGKVESSYVSHGTKSDVVEKAGKKYEKDGVVEKTSNKMNSHMTSSGFMVTGGLYHSDRSFPTFEVNKKKYNALRLHGLEKGKNDNVFDRGVVMHEKKTDVSCYEVKDAADVPVTWGCPGFPKGEGRIFIKEIADITMSEKDNFAINELPASKRHGGTLVYNYTPEEEKTSDN